MSMINPNLFFQNPSDRLIFNQANKPSIRQAGADRLSDIFKNGKLEDVAEFKSILESMTDGSKNSSYVSRVIEGHAEFNLKAAFQFDDGRQVNLELQVKVDYRFEQAQAAYAKNKKDVPPPAAAEDEFSPENTAKRIGNFAMGFLPAFGANHASEPKNDMVGGFFELAKGAIAKGFDEAKGLLGALYGEDADKTYDIVMKFLDDAKAGLLGQAPAAPPAEKSGEVKPA